MHQDDLALVMLVFIFFATSVLAVATLLIMSMRERDYHAHIERMAQFRSTTMQPQYWPYHILDQSGQQYMIDASGKLYELPEPRR